jgi:hypothetical protein
MLADGGCIFAQQQVAAGVTLMKITGSALSRGWLCMPGRKNAPERKTAEIVFPWAEIVSSTPPPMTAQVVSSQDQIPAP